MIAKKTIAVYTVLNLVMLANPVWAMPDRVPAHLANTPTPVNVLIPEHAVEIADGVFDLGHAVDNDGRVVEGRAFVHYADGFTHNDGHVRGNPVHKNGGGSSCYAFLANGARWKNTESYVVDPANIDGLDAATVRSLLATGLDSWDNEVAFDVFGAEDLTESVDRAAILTLNGENEFMFADIDSPGVIAITQVWGIFGGRPANRELVEWNMVFDDVSFDWSAEAAGVSGKMDLLNIIAHEVGHAAGMGHPSDGCTEETMYRYAGFAEIKKRDLNAGDIVGVKSLYK